MRVQATPSDQLRLRPSSPRTCRVGALFTALWLAPIASGAQQAGMPAAAVIGSDAEDLHRLAELVGTTPVTNLLLRATSRSVATRADTAPLHFRLMLPDVHVVAASALPYSPNDGALRAARGLNTAITAGFVASIGPARLVVAPQFLAEQNRPYQVIQYPQNAVPGRSIWANPFHPLPESIDLPLRFGDQSHQRLDPGQSSLTLTLGGMEVGAATENLWWGPGIRNALVLSNNAAGFPHLLARPARPFNTPLGVIDFDAILGQLHESEYFDHDGSNDTRSLAGGALSWRPDERSGLQLGASRLRMGGTAGHDQMSSLFGRWAFPTAGFETYFEWARFEDPTSLRDLLEFPNHAQGYTYGLQWARPVATHRTFRFQAEVSYLEPSASIRLRPVRTSYTSIAVPQGFTNRGEVLGAAIGPGSSSQWLAADVFQPRWHIGTFAGRIRYDDGTLFGPLVPELRRQDVTLLLGLRGGANVRGMGISIEYTDAARLNYLFQGYIDNGVLGTSKGIDIGNRVLSVTITPAGRI